MPMALDPVSLVLDTSGFSRSLNRYVTLTGADAEKAARRASAIFIRNIIAITPPGDGAKGSDRAALTKEDQRRGQHAILGDLAKLFAPVRLKGKRKEENPDVDGIHRQYFISRVGSTKRPARKLKGLKPIFADEKKVRALKKKLFSHVGRLANYWIAAADRVGVKAPAWVRRHGSKGFGSITPPGAAKFRFEAAHTHFPSKVLAEMDRRMTYADKYTARALEDNLKAILAKRAAQFNRAA